ncbi:MAG TPA: SBBP repeat-containing protein [Verrucomicrobiae bacterium]|nr:SBBP repeat-containing protein [Verrucomicrobiae bacterium]
MMLLAAFGWPPGNTAPRDNRPTATFLRAGLSFEPNQGQAAAAVQFLSRGSGYELFLAPGKVVLNLERQRRAIGREPGPALADSLRMSLVGANPKAGATGLARQTGVVNYFIGNDPKQWRVDIPTYGKVDYAQVYPGIDLVFYGNQRQLEYDFVVAPGADPSRIAWRIDGASTGMDAQGNLVLTAANGPASFEKPAVYQMDGEKRRSVEGSFALRGNQVRFEIGGYDHSKPLIIDPVLSYVTYLAGTGTDQISQTTGPGILQNGTAQGLAIDAQGSAYVTGRTASTDFPLKNPYQNAKKVAGTSSSAAFVTKFSPDGKSLVYSTYLGGTNWDYAYAIAVDSSGSAYITGYAQSADFPITSGAYQTVCSPQPNNTSSSAKAAGNGCQGTNNSTFVTKLSPGGNSLVYSTYLGGYGGGYGTAIAVDSAGRAYVGGNENAPCNSSYLFQACFPTTSGATIQTSNANNVTNFSFAAVLDPTGSNLLYSTLFGDLNGVGTKTSAGETMATGITVDANGYFYLIGNTKAGKLPGTAGAYQSSIVPLDVTGTYGTADRGFIAKFYPVTLNTGAYLAACTYLGGKTGNTSDYLSGIAVDSAGFVYVVGYTNSNDFPVTSGAYNTVCAPDGGTCAAAHVTRLSPTLGAASWSTYVGGSRHDGGDNLFDTGPIQLDGKGNIYITGVANPQFPMFNSVGPVMCCSGGLVVVELDPSGSNLLFSTSISGGLDPMATGGLAVDSAGDIYVAGNNAGANLATTAGAFQTTDPSPVPTCCYHGFVAKITATVEPLLQSGTLANGATYLAGGLVPGSWAQVKGTNLSAVTRIWDTPDFTGLGANLPTNLSGVQVTVNGQPAAVYYISNSQVNFQVPAGITGTATVQVISKGQVSNTVSAAAAANSPGIFPVSLGGANYAAAVFLDGKIAADPSNGPGFRNAVPGEMVQLFATGLSPSPAGTLVSTTFVSGVTVTIGGVTVAAATAALVSPGEFQINFAVPASLTPGVYPISISINGVSSPATINSTPPGPVVMPVGN